jgi:outer membrane receptor protein involved in Fe transport
MQLGKKCVTAMCFFLLLAGAGVQPGYAQAIHEGKVTGTVTSEDGASLPGATVEINGPALLGGRRSTTTSARGVYLLSNLPPGVYTLTVSREAFNTVVRENVGVSPDTVSTIDVALPVGSITETVTITAAEAVIDTKTSTIDSKIDRVLLDKLPTSRDAFYDLSLTAPGMFDSASTQNMPSPTAYGSATNENVFLMNGVDATNPRAASFGPLVNVNYDAVEEVRIVALGSKAEYGSYSGAAIDVLTKSGSNAFHGSGAFYTKLGSPASNQPGPNEDLGADWLYVGEGEQLSGEAKKDWEAAFTAGGPIVKDKLWFFGAFNYQRAASLPPRWSIEEESWGRYADAKLTAAPATNHNAWVSYHYENNDAAGWSWGDEPAWDSTMNYGVASVNHTVSGQWQWFSGPRTTMSAKYLGFWTNDKPHLPDDRPDHPGYINWWKWADYGIGGAFPYVEAQKSMRQTVQADMSHFAEQFLGEHDIKFGVQYTRGRGNWQGGYFQNYANFLYPYRWTQNVSYMQNWYGDTGLLFYNQRYTLNPFLTVRTADSVGLFLDDQWTPTKRLTVNLGVRFDKMSTKYGTGEVYDFVSGPDQINGPPPVVRERLSTDNVFDFKTLAPRVGLSYMLTEDGKTVARASFGRYYMPLNVEFLRRFGPDMEPAAITWQLYQVGPWSSVDTNGDGMIDAIETRNAARMVHGSTPLREELRTKDQSWTLNVADDLKDQFTDQVTLNLEREVARNLSIGATYIYKHAGNLFANIPINRVTGQEWEYERIPFTTSSGQVVNLYSVVLKDYNGDGAIDGGDIQWIGDNGTSKVVNMGDYDGITPKRDYHGFQLTFNKKYSERWQALASVLYSRSDGMARRTMRQDINVEGPMFWDDNWMGSLNYTVNNMEGQLPFTPSWEVKVSGSYKIPSIDVDLGARLRFHTGRPVWLTESYPQHTQWADPEGGVIDTGGLGRVVAYDPNDADYLPSQTLLDLHLEKAFTIRENQKVHLVLDGFNLLNVNTPTDVDIQFEWGKVTAIPQSRRVRAGIRYEF